MKEFKDGQFYTTEKISPRREKTPEGFLLCRDVPISRVGEFEYSGAETGIPADNGKVMLTRTADELFNPDTVASFEGKPVIVGHSQFADPNNWKSIAVGTVQNVRPGEGENADCLVADLLLTDAEGIRLVESGELTEVSCGYDAKPVPDGRGRGHQEGIVGNHVALVTKARCGGRCKIGDGSMSKSWKSRLRRLFRDGDEDGFNEELDQLKVEDPEKEELEDEDPAPDALSVEERLDKLEKMLGDIMHKLDVTESEGKAADDLEHDLEDEDPEPDPVPEEEDEEEDEEVPQEIVDRVLADAKIVHPGMKAPTCDGKNGKVTTSMIEHLERNALKEAGVRTFGDADQLSGQALDVALMAAADKIRSSRNPQIRLADGENARPNINEINRKFWENR